MTENKKKRSRENDVINYYDKCQWHYDHLWGSERTKSIHYGYYDKDHKKRDEELANMNNVVTRKAKITSKDKVLDIGCGVGGTSIMIAKTYGASVVGINLHEPQVKRARKNVQDANLDDFVEFVVGNYTKMEFPDETFDVIIGIGTTMHVDDKKKMFSELYRVLKKGGRFVNTTYLLTKIKYRIHEEKQLKRIADGWSSTMIHENEYRKLAEEAGFHSLNFDIVTKNVLPSAWNLCVSSCLNFPFAVFGWIVYKLTNVEVDTEMRNVYAGIYQYPTLKKGLWKYSIVYAEK